jgi:hypothetical protein
MCTERWSVESADTSSNVPRGRKRKIGACSSQFFRRARAIFAQRDFFATFCCVWVVDFSIKEMIDLFEHFSVI